MAALKSRAETNVIPVMRRKHQDDVRAKIQVGNLLACLKKHINGEKDLSATQLKAIEMLLDRALPRLAQIDLNVEGEIRNYVISGEPLTIDEWTTEYSLGAPIGTAESLN